MRKASLARGSGGIDISGRREPDLALSHFYSPSPVVDLMVTTHTEHYQVRYVSRAPVFPMHDVVHVAIRRRGVAPRATTVAFANRDSLGGRGKSLAATNIERKRSAAHDHGDDLRLRCHRA